VLFTLADKVSRQNQPQYRTQLATNVADTDRKNVGDVLPTMLLTKLYVANIVGLILSNDKVGKCEQCTIHHNQQMNEQFNSLRTSGFPSGL